MSHDVPNDADQRDTLLGVCAAIGQCTGIDPLFARLAFVVAVLGISFPLTIFAYLTAGIAIRVASIRVARR